MDTRVNVQSLTSIESVRAALLTFAEQVGDALIELESEMRRVKEWLEHDRPRYWNNQVRVSMDQVHEAQQALQRCLMFPVAGERPSCYEERAALKKAQARQEYCEGKVERVRHWQQVVQHELFEYEGRISQLKRILDVDLPRAIGVLTRIIRHVEEYQAVRGRDPQSAYNDLAVARELWPDRDDEGDGKEASNREDASGRNERSPEEKERAEG